MGGNKKGHRKHKNQKQNTEQNKDEQVEEQKAPEEKNENEKIDKVVEPEQDDDRFADLEEEETGPPVDSHGRPTKFFDTYVSSSDEEFPDEFVKYEEKEDDEEEVTTKESTCRLAITGMNWKKLKASDLYQFIRASLDDEDGLEQVTVYLSHFGEENLKSFEDEKMPANEAEDVRAAAWRHRQKQYAKCFFAIAEFNNPASADKAYSQLSSCEVGDTGNYLDLSVVPDDTDFSEMTVRDVCKEAPEKWDLPDMKAPWVNKTKVTDDWDLPDDKRRAAFAAAWMQPTDENQESIEAATALLLGDGSEDDERSTRDQLGGLLSALEEEEDASEEDPLVGKEIEFEFVSKSGPDTHREKADEATVRESVEERRRKPKKEKKAVDAAAVADGIVSDPRFQEVIDQPGYGINAADPGFKREPAMEKLMTEIAKRHQNQHRKLE